jgi:tRNA pseudouridine38-40 synthase
VIETSLVRSNDGTIDFQIEANAFCHQMVRSIVGVLVAIGRGRAKPPDVVVMLRSGSRQGAPTLAPARGLTLIAVGYPDELGGPWE